MYQLVLILHIFICASLIALVLVQQGKGATMGAAFGSGASQTVFGSRGSGSFLLKITSMFVLGFFMTSLSLNYMASHAMKRPVEITIPAPVSKTEPVGVTPNNIPAPAGVKK